jgi:uncharacterized protein (TIGR03435 family)
MPSAGRSRRMPKAKLMPTLILLSGLLAKMICVEGTKGQESVESAGPRFEVVSVRPIGSLRIQVAPGTRGIGRPVKPCAYSDDRLMCELTLAGFIEEAYRVTERQITGPRWFKEDVFAVKATMPSGTTRDTARLMLRSMLADRFGLKFHREEREVAVYALIPDKQGVKLHEPVNPDHKTQELIKTPAGSMLSSVYFGPGRFSAATISLGSLADILSDHVDLPVIVLSLC